MEENILLRKILFSILIFILVFPFLHILFYVPFAPVIVDPFLWKILLNSFIQALLSSLFIVLFGFLGSFSLLSLKSKLSSPYFLAIKILLILPSVAPPLIVIILTTKSFGFLPLGLSGVVFFHSLMNMGLVAVLFFKIIDRKASLWFKQSLICGVSTFKFVFNGLLPGIKKEIGGVGLYFMILSFFSFSIPLIIGGAQYGGPEVFILEKITGYGQWSEAIHYSIGLFIMLLFLSYFMKSDQKRLSLKSLKGQSAFQFLKFHFLYLIVILPTLILFFGLIKTLFSTGFYVSWVEHSQSIQLTFIIGILTGLFVFSLLTLLVYCFLTRKYSDWIDALMNPGWVIVGFSLLLMEADGILFSIFKLCFGLTILFSPFLFRLSLNQKMQDIAQQVQLSQMFPVGWNKIFLQIIFPQCLETICFLSGLAALWACGDFALSGILFSTQDLSTLALEMKELISSYRIDKALVLLLPLLVVSVVVFLIFQGLGYVCRRKIFTDSI